MKILLNLFFIFVLFFVVGCGKKVTNQISGSNTAEKIETVEYKCNGMHCSGCEETITAEVKKVDGVKDIKADSKGKIVTVSFDINKTNKENISKAINSAGYDTEISKSDNKHDCETDMQDKKN